MDETVLRGTISFVNHDKQYATIEYEQNGKKKSVNFKIDQSEQLNPDGKKGTKKSHKFRIGDEVNFQLKRSDKGDKMIAYNVKFLYNQELEKLINRATIENRFSGYLKVVDDELFVKEWDSYIFFPLKLSSWENPPAESAFNEAITFKLLNLEKPHAIAAELFSHDFIPEYRKALELFNNKKPIEGTVIKVSPFAVYLDLFGNNRVQAKIQFPAEAPDSYQKGDVKPGDKIKVIITYLSSNRIVVEKA
jgi:ribosomal protein S1